MTEPAIFRAEGGTADRRQRLGGGAAVTMVGRLVGRAVRFASQAVLGALLGPALFGVYALCWSVLRSLGLLATLGMHNAVIRFGSQGAQEGSVRTGFRRLAGRCAALAGLGGVVAGAALFGLADWFAVSVFEIPELALALRVTATVLPALTVTLVAAAATRVTQRMFYGVVIEDVVQPGTNLVLIGVMVMGMGWGLTGSLVALLMSYLASATFATRTVWKLFASPGDREDVAPERTVDILRYALPTALAGALGNYAMWVDRFFLGIYRPAAEVGLYQAAAQVAGLFALVLTAFNAILGPMIAESAAGGDARGMSMTFKAATKWGVYLSVPAALVVLFSGRDVLVTLFGLRYADASSTLTILLVGQFVNLATGAVGITLMLTGHQRRWLAITFLGAVVNAVVNVMLIPRMGADGAAIATTVTLILVYPLGAHRVHRLFGFLGVDRSWINGLMAAGGTAVVLLGMRVVPVGHPAVKVALHGIVACVVFFLILLAVDRSGHDRQLARWIWARVTDTVQARGRGER